MNRYNMRWAEGNFWRAPLAISDLEKQFSYKYIVQGEDKGGVKRWEGGENRVLDIEVIEEWITRSENGVKGVEKYKFKLDKLSLLYIRKKEYLVVIDIWQP